MAAAEVLEARVGSAFEEECVPAAAEVIGGAEAETAPELILLCC